ncbi:MAG: hypothetical protein V1808_04285 [Candidatus Daviesbacteria bacterium]
MQRFPLVAIAISVILLAGFVVVYTAKSSGDSTNITPTPTLTEVSQATTSATTNPTGVYEYFWGEGCPHCANVEKFLENWEGKDKIKLEKKEIRQSRDNASLLLKRLTQCKLSKDQIDQAPIPVLYTSEEKCILGDVSIIDHFKSLNI